MALILNKLRPTYFIMIMDFDRFASFICMLCCHAGICNKDKLSIGANQLTDKKEAENDGRKRKLDKENEKGEKQETKNALK